VRERLLLCTGQRYILYAFEFAFAYTMRPADVLKCLVGLNLLSAITAASPSAPLPGWSQYQRAGPHIKCFERVVQRGSDEELFTVPIPPASDKKWVDYPGTSVR
jgi:hypothetical protein